MALTIVGIHGLANKPPPATLAKWWKAAIVEGLQKNCKQKKPAVNFKMVYWANLLYKTPLHDDKNFDFDKLYNDEPYAPSSTKLQEYEDGILDSARKVVSHAGGSVLDFLRSHLDVDIASKWVLDKLLKDLAFYYDPKRKIGNGRGGRGVARKVLKDVLRRELTQLRGQRLMVVAHSMGSIIAYDVLRDIGRSRSPFDIEHFVTIGSPLGLPYVKANIEQERKSYSKAAPVRTPTIVTKHWFNFADRSDPVAFDSHLSNDFKKNRHGVAVVDDLVDNGYTSPAGERNHHKSYGYLRTPEFSRMLAAANT